MLMLRLSIVMIVSRDNVPLPKGPENKMSKCILLALYHIQKQEKLFDISSGAGVVFSVNVS
jgi:hypothetical protein